MVIWDHLMFQVIVLYSLNPDISMEEIHVDRFNRH